MTKAAFTPNAGYSIVVRLKIEGQAQILPRVMTEIANLEGHIGAVDIVCPFENGGSIRDISIYTSGVGSTVKKLWRLLGKLKVWKWCIIQIGHFCCILEEKLRSPVGKN